MREVNTSASVDSELTLLYQQLHGATIPMPGPTQQSLLPATRRPFPSSAIPHVSGDSARRLRHGEMKGLVDRALLARNTGKFVIDVRADNDTPGNQWLRAAALLLPKDRVILDDTASVLTHQKT